MYNQPKARFVVPAAMAILLTFGRGGMLPFEEIYTLLDQSMNIFVVVVAPIIAFMSIFPRPLNHNLHLLLPLFVLSCWVSICVFIGSPSEYWPDRTSLITILLSILLASQITRFELRRLRHFMLLLAGIFNLYVLLYSKFTLILIFSGSLNERLGEEVSPANLIVFPRVMYTLIITCLISLVIEKKLWIKICSTMIMIIPLLIAFATGGRGPLLGFITATLAFMFGLRDKLRSFYALLTVGVMAIIGYWTITRLFPTMQQRIMEDKDTGRFDIWTNILQKNDITWFGSEVGPSYPHNIFIEFLYIYGIIGFVLFLLVLATSVITAYKFYSKTRDVESLWVICLLVLQMTAQQFSLDIFYGNLWATIVLPLGFGWNRSPENNTANVPTYKDSDMQAGGYMSSESNNTNSLNRYKPV